MAPLRRAVWPLNRAPSPRTVRGVKTSAATIGDEVGEADRSPVDPNRGLDPAEAAARLARFGPNELPAGRRDSVLVRTFRQLIEPMSLLLLIAASVTWFALGERVDAAAILAIVVANVVIALVQEGRAARALEALRAMETPTAHVIRAGKLHVVPAREVVPGDVVLLSSGDRVPADLRLVDAASLEVDESMLTGESLPVQKETRGDLGGGIGSDELFSGTLVVRGTGSGVATETGPRTQLGLIAKHVDIAQTLTPLQRDLRRVTARLGLIAVVVAAGVAGVTLLRLGVSSQTWEMAFLSGAALAVAAVPEGLPTVVTVGLALGVRRMAAHGAVVRRLPAVETLGSTTVILTDKTGTLTQNRMRLENVVLANGTVGALSDAPPPVAHRIAEILSLCNDATLAPITGDPMEVALLEAVDPFLAEGARIQHPRWSTAPFDSDRKRMSTAHLWDERTGILTKGAPEVVLDRCTTALGVDGDELPLSPDDVARILSSTAALAGSGARVLALARRFIGWRPDDPAEEEHDLTLVGLVALRDSIRPEARDAVTEAASAGIHIVMVTGDHPGTAIAVAQEVGLAAAASAVTGAEIREHGFPSDLLETRVYARVAPEDKLALAEALQRQGHVVAVTGDGVNDAPALRRADIGVAMGLSGSDVAREAADMVVTDDNLATIVTAVREGRGIYDNIRKVVEYLLGGNLSEILVVITGLALFPGLGVPLLPLQLLWINLLTDGFPALALGVDPIDRTVMQRPPRGRSKGLLTSRTFAVLSVRAVLIAGASIGSLAIARYVWDEPWAHARVTMFSVLMTAHLLYSFAVRQPARGSRNRANRWLFLAVGGGIVLQVAVVSIPALHHTFGTAHLSAREWSLVASAGALPSIVMTVSRALRRASASAGGSTAVPSGVVRP
jgi:P-type Ca2+ transporter type 2C